MACPEEYDVYTEEGSQVGYIRLRWGRLTLEFPKAGGDLIYEYNFDDGMKGGFDSQEERDRHLREILDVIKGQLTLDIVDYEIVEDSNWLVEKIYGEAS